MKKLEDANQMPGEGKPQKPIRVEHSLRLVACSSCEEGVTTMCPDCGVYLCLQKTCETRHATRCRAVKRALITYDTE